MKNLATQNSNVKAGQWRVGGITDQSNSLAGGKVLGLLGFGRIAQRVAKVAAALEMQIEYHSNKTEIPNVPAKSVTFTQLLKNSDILSIHIPLDHSTEKLIGAKELALLKPSCVLINTSRGQILDEDALYEALSTRKLAFAGLDVMSVEPPPLTNKFLKLDNVIITPHIAAVSMECWNLIFNVVTENISIISRGDKSLKGLLQIASNQSRGVSS